MFPFRKLVRCWILVPFLLGCSPEKSEKTLDDSPDTEEIDAAVKAIVRSAEAVTHAVENKADKIEYSLDQYLKDRDELLLRDRQRRGTFLLVTEDLRKAKEHFAAIRKEYIEGFRGEKEWREFRFPPTQPFPTVKDRIEQTDAFRLIRKMPKGCQLHLHSTASGRISWLLDHLSAFDGARECYVSWPSDQEIQAAKDEKQWIPAKGTLQFFPAGEAKLPYRRARDLETQQPGFRDELRSLLVLGEADFSDDPFGSAWRKFGGLFGLVSGYLMYQPAFRGYFDDAMRLQIEDGVQYVEMRTGLGTITTPEGKELRGAEFINEYLEVAEAIREDHPDFGLKLIIAAGRGTGVGQLSDMIDITFELQEQFPNFVIGLDLVGKENLGNETRNYLEVWLSIKKAASEGEIDSRVGMYFHDGESNWSENSNIVDATMLGAKRIGHGFNLVAFPEIEAVLRKKRELALEVCPISNQVLRYVGDLRIHPASGYIRRGVPCVIASDDPLFFGNDGLSYDFWIAWMAWGLSLDDLERLIQSSVTYSAMSTEEDDEGMSEQGRHRQRLRQRWNQFIKQLARDDYLDWIRE